MDHNTGCNRPTRSRIPPRPRRWGIAVLLATGILGAALLTPWTAGRAAATAVNPTPCTLLPRITVPTVGLMGDPIPITLHTTAVCAAAVYQTHVVVVFRQPDAWSDGARRDVAAASQRIAGVLLDQAGGYLAVAAVYAQGEITCPLSDQERVVGRCTEKSLSRGPVIVGPLGRPTDETGFGTAFRLLARPPAAVPRPPANPRQVVVLFSHDPGPADCEPLLTAARQLIRRDVLVVTVSVPTDARVGGGCLRKVASNSRYYLQLESGTSLGFFDRIFARPLSTWITDYEVRWTLPPSVKLVSAPLDSVPDQGPDNHGLVVWRYANPPTSGVTTTFHVRVLRPGQVDIAESVELVAVDNRFGDAHVSIAPPSVAIFGPP